MKKKKRKISDTERLKLSKNFSEKMANAKIDHVDNINAVFVGTFSTKTYHKSNKTNEITLADSLAEKYRMVQLDNDSRVIKWTKSHGIVVPYQYRGKSFNCVPDFLIQYDNNMMCVEEVKGRVTPKEVAKRNAIENYCNLKGYLFRFTTMLELDKDGSYTEFIRQFNVGKKRKKSNKRNI